ncbi:MAG: hypothetical protein ACREMQ_08860 [Longimicrobiales bacterium]
MSFRSPFDRYREYEDRTDVRVRDARIGALLLEPQGALHQLPPRAQSRWRIEDREHASAEELVFTFHNTGLYNLPGPVSYPSDNTGLYEQTGRPQDVGKFRVPTLRNIAVTAPYMHDGSIATLDEALDHYVAGGRTPNPLKSTGLQPLTLTPDERKDLIAFLESLTDREALGDPRWSNP